MKSIQEKIDREKEINKDLLKKIKEVEARIKELTYSIENASLEQNKKNNAQHVQQNNLAEITNWTFLQNI